MIITLSQIKLGYLKILMTLKIAAMIFLKKNVLVLIKEKLVKKLASDTLLENKKQYLVNRCHPKNKGKYYLMKKKSYNFKKVQYGTLCWIKLSKKIYE